LNRRFITFSNSKKLSMIFFCNKIVLSSALILTLFACKTSDILPKADLVSSANTLSENEGTVAVSAQLNGAAPREVRIQLTFSGTATINEDYTVSATEIIINAGDSVGVILITGIEDGIIEGSETIELSISSLDGVLVLDENPIVLTILDGDIDSDGDGVPDSDDACPDIPGVAENNGCPYMGFTINEVLYDPADGIAGDANGDGVRDPLNDEFIEFFNSTGEDLDISGYRIFDASALSNNEPRHIFPAGTIVPSNKAIVVFGGGTPTGDFGGALFQTATGGQLNMNNAGDFMTIQNAQGTTILTFDISLLSGNPNESYTRNRDVYEDFARHSAIPEAQSRIHSPGTKLNGNPF